MAKEVFRGPLERLSDTTWRIPKSYRSGMRVDGIVYADDALMESIRGDQALEQVLRNARSLLTSWNPRSSRSAAM